MWAAHTSIGRSRPANFVYDPQKAASQDLGHDRGGGRLYLPIGSGVNLHTYWDGRLGSLGSGADDDHNHDNNAAAPELKARFVQKLVDMTAALPPPQPHSTRTRLATLGAAVGDQVLDRGARGLQLAPDRRNAGAPMTST